MKTDIQEQSTSERSEDHYEEFQAWVLNNFNQLKGLPLFTTDSTDLFQAYLNGLPEEARQHYTCNACRHFIERFGGLVNIEDNGAVHSALWGYGDAPEFFQSSVHLMDLAVTRAKVTGVFVSSQRVYGEPVTGDWHHLHCVPQRSDIWNSRTLTDFQRSAQLYQDYQMVIGGLMEYSMQVVGEALKVLETNAVYRSEKFYEPIKWLYELHGARKALKGKAKDNITWLYIATSPDGFHHIKANVTASLMDDIKSGLPFGSLQARFEQKVKPEVYQRATVAPAQGTIDRANDLMDRLGSAGALSRRYVTFDDIQEFIWWPQAVKASEQVQPARLFSNITPRKRKGQAETVETVVLPANTVTWYKFLKSVLPKAKKIEAQIPANPSRFMALVTAANYEAPPILAWDNPLQRNPVSWYYSAGIDGEFKRRVNEAGGQYENVDIRATLIWENRNDLDLHAITPTGEYIFYGNKKVASGGYLDVDMNVQGETTTPVENIRWARGNARKGHYRFFVMNYRFHEHSYEPTPYQVEVQVGDQLFYFEGMTDRGVAGMVSKQYTVFEFDYTPGQLLSVGNQGQLPNRVGDWNVAPSSFVPVTGIVASPNLWGDNPQEHHGQHIFFMLQGCRDLSGSSARGFFVESLKAEYREIRSVIDHYNRTAVIEGAEQAEACGLGMTTSQPWNLILRVTNDLGVTDYKIDRWD